VNAFRRIGLFGGSFDPVHNAHLALAQAALGSLQLDEVRWIPAGQPWQKERALAAAADREAMVALAIAGEPRFVLDAIELRRAGPSYTLDTVRSLQTAQPGARWFLLLGQDQHAGLPTWHGVDALLRLVRLAVARRPGSDSAKNLAPIDFDTIELPLMDVSATAVRARCAASLPIDGMVPPQVARYIEQHGLYR
jgi:nicotinate-nucleotide adenylyltransferase